MERGRSLDAFWGPQAKAVICALNDLGFRPFLFYPYGLRGLAGLLSGFFDGLGSGAGFPAGRGSRFIKV